MPRQCRYCRPKSAPSETLCVYLGRKFPYFTLHQWKEQIEAGYLSVNDEQVKNPEQILQQQDTILFSSPPSKEPEVDTTHVDLLYEDESVLVCCKNGNIPVAEGGRYCEHTLLRYFQHQLSQREEGVVRGGSPISTSRGPLSSSSSSFNLPFHHLNYFPFLCTSNVPSSSAIASPFCCLSSTAAGEPLEEATKREKEMVSSTAHAECPILQTTAGAEAQEAMAVEKAVGKKRSHSESGVSSPSLAGHSSSSLFPLHRLDKETSGVLVFGKSLTVTQRLIAMLEAHSTRVIAEVEERAFCVRGNEKEKSPPHSEKHPTEPHLESGKERGKGVPGIASPMSSTVASSSAACSSDPFFLSSSQFDALRLSTGTKVEKSYLAVLAGVAKQGETHVVVTRIGPIAKDPEWKDRAEHQQLGKLKMLCYSGSRRHTSSGSPREEENIAAPVRGKWAVSRIRIVSTHDVYKFSVARIDILTGRTHQIRLHCAELGYPILGDKLYATRTPGVYGGAFPVEDAVYFARVRATWSEVSGSDGYWTTTLAPSFRCRRHLLHSTKLMFPRPPQMDSSFSTFSSGHPSRPSSSHPNESKGCATENGVIHEENETIRDGHRSDSPRLEPSSTYLTFLSDPSFWFLLDVRCDDAKAKEALERSVYHAFTTSFFCD